MKTLTVEVPDPLLAEIEAAAQERRVSKSEIVRERLEQGQKPTAVTLWERMHDLVIDEKDLPKDLSTNQEHLKNYGSGGID
ncbi:MAG: ribbon-helix-helix domain-containing protein [Verrucomicrobiales bacterium]|nr:ribbon-helix-helix domain-containing protein [Verrucomicrobiales bacterium]